MKTIQTRSLSILTAILMAVGGSLFGGEIDINLESVSNPSPTVRFNRSINNLGPGATLTNLVLVGGEPVPTEVTHTYIGAGTVKTGALGEGLTESRLTVSELRRKTWYSVTVHSVSLPDFTSTFRVNGVRVRQLNRISAWSGPSGVITVETSDFPDSNIRTVWVKGVMRGETAPLPELSTLRSKTINFTHTRNDFPIKTRGGKTRPARFKTVCGAEGYNRFRFKASWSRTKMEVRVMGGEEDHFDPSWPADEGKNITAEVRRGAYEFETLSQWEDRILFFRVKNGKQSFRRSPIHLSCFPLAGPGKTKHRVTIISR